MYRITLNNTLHNWLISIQRTVRNRRRQFRQFLRQTALFCLYIRERHGWAEAWDKAQRTI